MVQRANFAQDDFGVDEPSRLDVFVRILESFMERGSIVFAKPIPRIEWQPFNAVPSGKSVGSSTTRRPTFTRAFSVMGSQ